MIKTKLSASSEVIDVISSTKLDINALVERVDEVLGQEFYWVPVKHHSPAIARQVSTHIRVRKPKVVFIEGPSEAQNMIEFLIDAKTRPPIAIYSSFRNDTEAEIITDGLSANPSRYSAWFPLVSYSPEFVAIQASKEIGAEAIFIDLPHYAIETPNSIIDFSSSPTDKKPLPSNRRRDLDEIAIHSDLYHILVQSGGYHTWEELWDTLFETPKIERSAEMLRRDVAIFCAAVRSTTVQESLELDGTLARERFMWKTICETLEQLKLKPKDAMIVCGGFHIFLDQNDTTPPPSIPLGTASITVIPYSYFRISELSGYGAGNRAPRFYEMCFEHYSSGDRYDQIVIDYIIDVIKEARKRGERLSSADAISTTQHTLMLARLRGRREPVLDDVIDALITCCCKGNPKTEANHLLESIDEVNIGTRLGRVTDRIGQLPIMNDFYDQLQRLDLEEIVAREKVVNYSLDKREQKDSIRSAFLHRLNFLGVEIGTVQREISLFGQSIFKEHWRLKWNPNIEAVLIGRNLYGDTIELAATTLLRESLGVNISEAGLACRKLVQAVDMNLPQFIAQTEQMTSHAIDHDGRFGSLADAFSSLILLEYYAIYRGLAKDQLGELIARCFNHACFSIPEVAAVPPAEWDGVIQGLLTLAEPAVQRPDLDSSLFVTHIEHAAEISTMPFLRGVFLGMLTEMRRMQPDALAAELSKYARGPVDQQIVAGDFLNGVLRVSKTAILLGSKSLVAAVDELLKVIQVETFLYIVPQLRVTFETLHERQRDSIAAQVAELYGLKENESLRTLSTSLGAAQLMAKLDSEATIIMKKWLEDT